MTIYALFLTYSNYECSGEILRGLFETQDEAEKHLWIRVGEYSKFISEYNAIRAKYDNFNKLQSNRRSEQFMEFMQEHTKEQEELFKKYPKCLLGESETLDDFVIRQIETGKLI